MKADPLSALTAYCRQKGYPMPVAEYQFHPTRLWRFDLSFPDRKIALEIDGGGYVRGRHHRAAGHAKDSAKANEAQLLGWVVLRCTPEQFARGLVYDWLDRAMKQQPTIKVN
jgi:very-short-patch-repair endonuclease